MVDDEKLAQWLRQHPLPAGVEDAVFNQAQLATALRVSENTIVKYRSQGMPVAEAGQNGRSYEYRLSDCYAWREARNAEAKAERNKVDELANQAALAFLNTGSDSDAPAMTGKELRDLSEAELMRNRAAEQRGDLVRTSQVRQAVQDSAVAFKTGVSTIPDFAEREFSLSPEQVQQMQDFCDAVLEDSHNKLVAAYSGGQVLALGRKGAGNG